MTRIMLAGGSTAGHTSPLIATAQALVELGPDVGITCIGTSKGLETRVISQAGLKLELIRPAPMPRKPNLDFVKLPWNLRQSVRQARTILSRAKAQVLIGFGGYVAIPAYLAACAMKVPVLVHEANLVVGIASKVAARSAAFTGCTSPDTQIRGGKWIGMPMNRSITRLGITRAEARKRFGLDPERPALFVSDGFQEARAINQALSIVVPAILDAGIQVLYVLSVKSFTDADAMIEPGSGARYAPVAYVNVMVGAYAAADLMIGRAGAGTVMGTAVLELPVVFIPLLWGNGEQARNAAGLVVDRTGVLLPGVELSADKLSDLVIPIITDAKKLARMAGLVRLHSPTDAADVLARAAINVVQGEEAL